MKRVRVGAWLAGLAVATVPAFGQEPAAIDRLVLQHMQRTKAPGISIAIVREGKVTFEKGYGIANLETDAPATDQTIYRIGSLTKPFTAALVMRHVERGDLALTDPIRKHLPSLPAAFDGVTVLNLLNHTSGIASYTDLPGFGLLMGTRGTPKQMIDLSAAAPMLFKPGQGWRYSNTNYIVLGELVAKLDGVTWAESLQANIAKPLNLASTAAFSADRIAKNRASGYSLTPTGPKNAPFLDMSWPYSAGAIESTAGDIARFDLALGKTLLKPSTVEEMTTVTGSSQSYGLGLGVEQVKGVKLVLHSGSINGFESFLGKVPAKGISVVVLANANGVNPGLLGRQILGLVVPEIAPKVTPITDDDVATTALLRGKFERLLKGELKSEELTPEFGKVLTPQLMRDIQQTLGGLGAIKRFDLIESKRADSAYVRVYLIELGESTFTLMMALAPDGKIGGMSVSG